MSPDKAEAQAIELLTLIRGFHLYAKSCECEYCSTVRRVTVQILAAHSAGLAEGARKERRAICERLVDWNLSTIDADWTPGSMECVSHTICQIANVLEKETWSAALPPKEPTP